MRRLTCFLTMIVAVAGVAARAAVVVLPGVIAPAGPLVAHVVSLEGLRFRAVVRQHTDYSCGAASVATILDYAYGRHFSEHRVIVGMLKVSNQQTVRERGFSMLDMARYLRRLGYRSAGYRVSAKHLPDLRIPVIVLLNISGYEHFVVLKAVVGDRAYLADPALGNRSLSMRRFVKDWDGIVFVIVGPHYDKATPLRTGLAVMRAHGLMTAIERDEREHLRDFGFISATYF